MTTILEPSIQHRSPLEKVQRINFVDYAKGIGIFLVVVGHTIRGLRDSTVELADWLQFIDQWIYTFHMPLFFFISGLFIERSVSRPFKIFLTKKIQTIIYPYFVWSILQEIVRFAVHARKEPISEIWRIIYSPVMQFWFLYVLFLVSVSYVIIRKVNLSIANIFWIAILLYMSHIADINFGPWGILYQIRYYAVVYFVVGALISHKEWLSKLTKFSYLQLSLGVIVGFSLIGIGVLLGIENIKVVEVILAFIGIFSSLALAQLLGKLQRFKFVENWGLFSLQIFVAHTIFSAATRVILTKLHIDSYIIHIVFGTVIGIYAAIALGWFCQRLRFPYLFTFSADKYLKSV